MATTNQGWALPTVGASEDSWGATLNTTIQAIDTLVGSVTAAEIAKLDGLTASTAELNILDGVTATAAELNILDGVTATAAELNILDGVTATTAELNYVDGVTSAIQTQLDNKQPLDATLTGLAGLATGANKIPYSTGTNTFSQFDFKDEDNMASDSATALASQQSIKAYVTASIAAYQPTVLLGSRAMTGNSTETFSGLSFSGYTKLQVIIANVGDSAGNNQEEFIRMKFGSGTLRQITTYTNSGTHLFNYIVDVHLASGTYAYNGDGGLSTGIGNGGGSYGNVSSQTSVTFDCVGLSTYTLTSGTIYIYGIR